MPVTRPVRPQYLHPADIFRASLNGAVRAETPLASADVVIQ